MTKEMLNQIENDYWEEKASPIDMTEVFDLANKALEQEPILDKIRAEIDKIYEREGNSFGGNSFDSLNVLDELKEFIDKYKAESKEETETWNGIHAQITAPKGTFDKIFNDTEEDIDDI